MKSFDTIDTPVGRDRKMMATLADAGFGLREVGRLFDEQPETVKYWQAKLSKLNKKDKING